MATIHTYTDMNAVKSLRDLHHPFSKSDFLPSENSPYIPQIFFNSEHALLPKKWTLTNHFAQSHQHIFQVNAASLHKDSTDDIQIEMKNGLDSQPTLSPTGPSSTIDVLMALSTYCVSSILMTVTNKYVLSNLNFRMNFLLLAIQVLPSYFSSILYLVVALESCLCPFIKYI